MRGRILLVLSVLLILAAACGDDDAGWGVTTTAATTTTTAATTTTTAATTTAPTTTATTIAPETTVTTGGGHIGTPEAMVDALAAQLVVPGSPFDQDAAECFAQGVVDEIGFERLAELGAADPNTASEDIFSQMTDEEVDTIADFGLTCIDIHALFVDQFVQAGMPQEVAVCMADGIAGAPFLHDMLVDVMMGGEGDPTANPEAMSLITDLVGQCMSP